MADDPFPSDPQEPTPTAIGAREWVFSIPGDHETNPDTGQPLAPVGSYSVQILDQNNFVIEVKRGVLYEAGGVDHLTSAEKQAILALDVRLLAKAENAWL